MDASALIHSSKGWLFAASLALVVVPGVGEGRLRAQVPAASAGTAGLRAAVAALAADAAPLLGLQRALRADVAELEGVSGEARATRLDDVLERKARLEAATAAAGNTSASVADELLALGEISASFLVHDASRTVRGERIPETIRYSGAVVQNRTGPIVDRYEELIEDQVETLVDHLQRAQLVMNRPVGDRFVEGTSRLVSENSTVRLDVNLLQTLGGDARRRLLDDILARKRVLEVAVENLQGALGRYAEALRAGGDIDPAARVDGVVAAIDDRRIAATIRYSAAVVENRTGELVGRYEEEIEMQLRSLRGWVERAVLAERPPGI